MARDTQRVASKMAGMDWNLAITEHDNGHISVTSERIAAVLLQEIREELKKLNAVLACPNFRGMPRDLRALGVEARAQRAARLARQKKLREAQR